MFAAIALIANLALILAGLSVLGATLTLPGIAGILLALGMAVDANVLINERAREEARKTGGVVSALETGFRKAYRTIIDANATTLIKMLILFLFGAGAVRGFALTISMGIVHLDVHGDHPRPPYDRTLAAEQTAEIAAHRHTDGISCRRGTSIAFMRARYSGLVVSAVISLASIGLAFYPGLRMGVEFSGGVAVEARSTSPIDAAKLPDGTSVRPASALSRSANSALPTMCWCGFEHPEGDSAAQQARIAGIRDNVVKALPGGEIRRVDVVGPAIGSELLQSGLTALGLAAIAMFAYIAFPLRVAIRRRRHRYDVPGFDEDLSAFLLPPASNSISRRLRRSSPSWDFRSTTRSWSMIACGRISPDIGRCPCVN